MPKLPRAVLLAINYFASTYLATSALAPEAAIHTAFIITFLALLLYFWLVLIEQDEQRISPWGC